jgi:hypothetical protein
MAKTNVRILGYVFFKQNTNIKLINICEKKIKKSLILLILAKQSVLK